MEWAFSYKSKQSHAGICNKIDQEDRIEMMNEENNQSGSLLSGQDPHQKEDMDQATRASVAAFNLEPEKGISPDPNQNAHAEEPGDIKDVPSIGDNDFSGDSSEDLEEANGNTDLKAGEFEVTPEDLENLNAQDRDQDANQQNDVIGLS